MSSPKPNSHQTAVSIKSHWVKQFYYYAVIGVTVLFMAIGAFVFLRAQLLRFVFINADNSIYYSSPIDNCRYKYVEGKQVDLTLEEKNMCESEIETNISRQKQSNYENDTLNGVLMTGISLLVMVLHMKLVKIKND